MMKFLLLALVALFTVLSFVVGLVSAQASLLRRCLGINFVIAVLFLLIPGLNLLGLLMIAISGALLLTGRCDKCLAHPA